MQYIPQAPPFEMIDNIISTDELQTTTQFTIRENHLFVNNNYFREPGIIENMAQTAAAGMGFKAAAQQSAPPVGFIGQIKSLKIHLLPQVGTTITTTTKNVHQIMNAFIVEATVRCNDETLATAEFKIFLQENQ